MPPPSAVVRPWLLPALLAAADAPAPSPTPEQALVLRLPAMGGRTVAQVTHTLWTLARASMRPLRCPSVGTGLRARGKGLASASGAAQAISC